MMGREGREGVRPLPYRKKKKKSRRLCYTLQAEPHTRQNVGRKCWIVCSGSQQCRPTLVGSCWLVSADTVGSCVSALTSTITIAIAGQQSSAVRTSGRTGHFCPGVRKTGTEASIFTQTLGLE